MILIDNNFLFEKQTERVFTGERMPLKPRPFSILITYKKVFRIQENSL